MRVKVAVEVDYLSDRLLFKLFLEGLALITYRLLTRTNSYTGCTKYRTSAGWNSCTESSTIALPIIPICISLLIHAPARAIAFYEEELTRVIRKRIRSDLRSGG